MIINDIEHMCYALDFEGVPHTKFHMLIMCVVPIIEIPITEII